MYTMRRSLKLRDWLDHLSTWSQNVSNISNPAGPMKTLLKHQDHQGKSLRLPKTSKTSQGFFPSA